MRLKREAKRPLLKISESMMRSERVKSEWLGTPESNWVF